MKRLVPIVVILSLGLWFGCSSDDDDGNGNGNGVGLDRVIADTTVSAPSLDSVNDPAWDSVPVVTLEAVVAGSSPKIGGDQSAAVILLSLQAIEKDNTLYLRLSWSDQSFSVWRDHFYVTDLVGGATANFSRDLQAHEDQVFVLFQMPETMDWDVWNWRVLTTDPGGLAEGLTLQKDGFTFIDTQWVLNDSGRIIDTLYVEKTIDTLLSDIGTPVGGGGEFFKVALPLITESSQPKQMHSTGASFKGYLLYEAEVVTMVAQAGWALDDTLPGFRIDESFTKNRSVADRNSRFDIKAASSYDNDLGIYTVVLARALNSFADDLDLSTLGQVKVKIGLFDNQTRFLTGSIKRSFTSEFWLVLP